MSKNPLASKTRGLRNKAPPLWVSPRSIAHVLTLYRKKREMAVGNTFGATALSSYGGFWISYAIILTPGFNVLGDYTTQADTDSALGFFLTGWFIFTFLLLLCTVRSTVMFFLLFFTLDIAFLMLSCHYYALSNGATSAALRLQQAGGGFGMIAAFLAWYNAFAGIADSRCVANRLYSYCYSMPADLDTATHSSSSPSSTSHGLRRVAGPGARPSARLYKSLIDRLVCVRALSTLCYYFVRRNIYLVTC